MCEIIIFLIMAVCAKEHFIRLSCPIRAFIVIISVSTSGGKKSHWWQGRPARDPTTTIAWLQSRRQNRDNNCGQFRIVTQSVQQF